MIARILSLAVHRVRCVMFICLVVVSVVSPSCIVD